MAAQTALRKQVEIASPTRRIVMGIIFLALGLVTLLVFTNGITADMRTSFGLNASGATTQIDPWVVHTLTALYVVAAFTFGAGGYQLIRGFKHWTNWVLALVVFAFIFGFLVWAAADKSLNLAGLVATTLNKAVPITLGALSGILCERAGVVNIAIEGMMLSGALTGAIVSSITQNLWAGLAAAMLTGLGMALIHAWLSIKYKVNQIVSGTVINIFATGLTSYISAKFLQSNEALNNPGIFQPVAIPGLVDIPFLGAILFRNNIFVYALFIFLIVLQIALFNTRWGLRVRAVGEHPKAADTLGINVIRTRYYSVMLGGLMAGFAGAYFTLGSVGRFDEVMTAGRGFIGLAAMIFGNWTPVGSFGAGLLFGFADGLATRLAILQVPIPSQFLLMAPYIATMIILAGVVGRSQGPAADGVPYEKE
jgi:simple sugar transport system permease protein